MSATAFVREEAHAAPPSHGALLVRLGRYLPLVVWLLPLSLTLNVLASSSPSLFRWYAGQLTLPHASAQLPLAGTILFSVSGLLVLALLSAAIRMSAGAVYELGALWSAQRIYAAMVDAVARARTSFFDENPSGRVINRMVGDFNQARTMGLSSINDTLGGTIDLLSIFVLATLASWYCGVLIGPLLLAFCYLQRLRTPLAVAARTASVIACGKVIERNTELINGRASYLLYGQFAIPVTRLAQAFREYTHALMRTIHVESVVNMYVRALMEAYILAVMLALIVGAGLGKIDAATAGVVISALLAVNGSVTFLENASAQMTRQSAHTHRIFEYVDLPDEESQEHARPRPASAHLPATPPRRGAGALSFEKLSVSYRADSPLVLRDFSLRIPAGAKVGLIGRSGSGKTSLIQSLLRLMYVHDGDLLLDGQSLYGLPIAHARRRFGVVPQAPYLFEGSLRANLDRPGVLSDASMVRALHAVGLDMPLDKPVLEGGANLSLGQRQLVCLARVIAADKTVIVLDEPTSGLDADTDARVQQVLRNALRQRTVITVAHRRESLRHYDLIVEMQAGAIVRIGTPAEVLGAAAPARIEADQAEAACPA